MRNLRRFEHPVCCGIPGRTPDHVQNPRLWISVGGGELLRSSIEGLAFSGVGCLGSFGAL